jgi:hypothetical protein
MKEDTTASPSNGLLPIGFAEGTWVRARGRVVEQMVFYVP